MYEHLPHFPSIACRSANLVFWVSHSSQSRCWAASFTHPMVRLLCPRLVWIVDICHGIYSSHGKNKQSNNQLRMNSCSHPISISRTDIAIVHIQRVYLDCAIKITHCYWQASLLYRNCTLTVESVLAVQPPVLWPYNDWRPRHCRESC